MSRGMLSPIAIAVVCGALIAAAFGAFALGTSKFQHLLLPLLLALAVLIGGGLATRKAALALALQVGDVWRQGATAHGIAHANRANFALSLLLPVTSDRAQVEAILDMEPVCAAYIGKSIYYMPGPVETVCTHVGDWSQAKLWWLLLSDPSALAQAIARAVPALLSWLPMLGVVEGERWQTLPPSQPSWAPLFSDHASVAWALMLLPWFVLGMCCVRRAPSSAHAFALMCTVGSSAIVATAMFGDGLIDFSKHAQTAIDISLASLCLPLAAMLGRMRRA